VGNYVKFGPETVPQLCEFHGYFSSCGPGEYEEERGTLYRNEGNGRWEDVTTLWGFNQVSGKALGVAAGPVRGGQALAIANDQMAGDLFDLRGSRSRNRGIASGMAFFADGSVYGGMGIDWGDYDGDGMLDLVVATYQGQAKCVFRGQGDSFAVQDTTLLGMLSSVPYVAFGVKWLDFDNDGYLDLLFANGHVQDNVAQVDLFGGPGAVYRQPSLLYRNEGGARFSDASARLGDEGQKPIVGRGAATGDFDNDGRIDALVVDSEGAPLLLRNVTKQTGHSLTVSLRGRKSNRNGYGAVIDAHVAGRKIVRHAHADGSYLTSSDSRVHIGLGDRTEVDSLIVRWPSGKRDAYRDIPADSEIVVTEGAPAYRTRKR
jgi:enediyne biosynthesis protein E4